MESKVRDEVVQWSFFNMIAGGKKSERMSYPLADQA
jgi:hypothetical protein